MRPSYEYGSTPVDWRCAIGTSPAWRSCNLPSTLASTDDRNSVQRFEDYAASLKNPCFDLCSFSTAIARGERWRLSLLLPRTWVSSYEAATIEALVIESVVHGLAHGPPAGQEVVYERVNKVTGEASFIFS